MRIAILSVHTSPIAAPGGKKVGGMNTYVREVARELALRGHEVDIFTRRISPDQPSKSHALGAGISVIHVKAGKPCPLNATEIYNHLQQFTAGVIAHSIRHSISYDLIFSHYWLSGWVAQHLKEAWGTPFIQMFHTLGHMKNRIPSVTSPVPSLRIQTEQKVVAWADMVIANTPAERAQLLWLYNADRRKIVICSPGVNINQFQPHDSSHIRQGLGLTNSDNLLLFVGRIEPLKAVDSILEALNLLRIKNPDLMNKTTLLVIGGDPHDRTDADMQNLVQLHRDLDLQESVRFIGAKNQQELSDYYASANAVIMPSEYESFGMVALEAMASGTPVIASEVGGLAYLVRDDETGFLVPARTPARLAQRIEDLLTDPERQQKMGALAHQRAQSYRWEHIVDNLETTFDRVVNDARNLRQPVSV
jgi:D-inositol-3-phosphate glycosyltransferase